MNSRSNWFKTAAAGLLASALVLASTGCQHWRNFYERPAPQPLGATVDPIWQAQERNAEMSDFVVHLHEWRDHTSEFLNISGEEHVKSIADRLAKGQDAYVVIERTRMVPREDTKYQFPVHRDVALDLRRREIIVRLLGAMGVADADQRTIVGTRLTPGYSGPQAIQSLESGGAGSSSFGGFFIGGGRF